MGHWRELMICPTQILYSHGNEFDWCYRLLRVVDATILVFFCTVIGTDRGPLAMLKDHIKHQPDGWCRLYDIHERVGRTADGTPTGLRAAQVEHGDPVLRRLTYFRASYTLCGILDLPMQIQLGPDGLKQKFRIKNDT